MHSWPSWQKASMNHQRGWWEGEGAIPRAWGASQGRVMQVIASGLAQEASSNSLEISLTGEAWKSASTSLSSSHPAVPGQDCSTSLLGFQASSAPLSSGWVVRGSAGRYHWRAKGAHKLLQDCWQRIAAPLGSGLLSNRGNGRRRAKRQQTLGKECTPSLPSQLRCPRWQPDPRIPGRQHGHQMGQRAQRHWSGAGRDSSSPAAPRTQVFTGKEGGIYFDHEGTFRARD